MPAHSHHKVVVITGASAGVGRATARTFARRGAHIGLLARGRERLEATRREVEAAGGRALALPTDVADHSKPTNLATLAGRTTCGSLFPATLARVASFFNDRARDDSWQLKLNMHLPELALAGGAALLGTAFALLKRKT